MKVKLLRHIRSRYQYKFKDQKVILLDMEYSEIKTFNTIYKSLSYMFFLEQLRRNNFWSPNLFDRLNELLQHRNIIRKFRKL